jgi:hypothetical protein
MRFAVYHLPDGALGEKGASWLGWDAARGAALPVPEARGPWVATPRRYGFHATLKPPFRLAPGRDLGEIEAALALLAAATAPARADRLEPAVLGGFVALVPRGACDFDRVAAACVTALDGFRAPPTRAELTRRRAAGLSPGQEALLARWGYPYVLEEFRYHLTLSGRTDTPETVLEVARAHMGDLPAPFALDALALCEEGPDGLFRLRHRYPLTGAGSAASA